MNKTIFARLKIPKVKAATLPKGQDGATWYAGSPNAVILCKKGDFCFDPGTFDIYKCIVGGNYNAAAWELVCTLDPTGEIKQILADLETNPIMKAWFGTKEEYNAMTEADRNKYELHFIEEGS